MRRVAYYPGQGKAPNLAERGWVEGWEGLVRRSTAGAQIRRELG